MPVTEELFPVKPSDANFTDLCGDVLRHSGLLHQPSLSCSATDGVVRTAKAPPDISAILPHCRKTCNCSSSHRFNPEQKIIDGIGAGCRATPALWALASTSTLRHLNQAEVGNPRIQPQWRHRLRETANRARCRAKSASAGCFMRPEDLVAYTYSVNASMAMLGALWAPRHPRWVIWYDGWPLYEFRLKESRT